jgi:hypothetical protein
MRAISTKGCPQDVVEAYLTHIHAWESLAAVERDCVRFNADFNSGGAMVEAFLRGLAFDPFGKMHEANAAANRIRERQEEAQTQIRETFQRVEKLAVSHGAELPKPEGKSTRS